jgi:DnaJ family protein C protein 7
MKIFDLKKLSKKNKQSVDGQDTGTEEDDYFQSQPSSPTKSPTKPPTKAATAAPPLKNSSTLSGNSAIPRAESPSSRDSKSRPLRPFGRHSTDPGSSSSRKKKIDPDTHPLNLPPEQRSKRLSAMSARDSMDKMDIDSEPVNGSSNAPSSPQTSQPKPVEKKNPLTVPVPNSPDAPATNGTNGVNGAKDSNGDVPVPPPHRSQPSSPAQTAADDAETFKNDGNKYFKAKDYTRAIEYYTKGKFRIA